MKNLALVSILTILLAGCSTPSTNPIETEATIDSEQTTTLMESFDNEETEATLASATYTDYSQEKFESMAGKPFAIFFHAGWCPKCQALEANITAELSSLPESFKVLKADFDKETALKAKYGVTMQTTFIIIDENGEAVETLANPSIEQITTSLQRA